MLVFNDRKNAFLNHLKDVMFSGPFTTLPKLFKKLFEDGLELVTTVSPLA